MDAICKQLISNASAKLRSKTRRILHLWVNERKCFFNEKDQFEWCRWRKKKDKKVKKIENIFYIILDGYHLILFGGTSSATVYKTGQRIFKRQGMFDMFGTHGSRNEPNCKVTLRMRQFGIPYSVHRQIIGFGQK